LGMAWSYRASWALLLRTKLMQNFPGLKTFLGLVAKLTEIEKSFMGIAAE